MLAFSASLLIPSTEVLTATDPSQTLAQAPSQELASALAPPAKPALARVEATVERLFGLYAAHGHADYLGEPVSQLAHMWQAAALAETAGADEAVVLAAFVHDLGHLLAEAEPTTPSMGGFGAVDHERLGADYLRAAGFSARVVALVEGHVQAKRYLTFQDPDYHGRLSAASRATLAFQGGPMSAAEAAAFEQNPDADALLQLRRWDELAKAEHLPTGDLAPLRALALAHLLRQSG